MRAPAFASILLLSLVLHTPGAPAADQRQLPSPPGSIETHPAWPGVKNAGDADTVEHLVASIYDVISGPPGRPRDWDRFRSLFLPDGRLGVVRPDLAVTRNEPAHKGDAVFVTPDTYAARNDPYFKTNGFFERGIANRVEEFGNLVHVWSTYESRHAMTDSKPFARGVNSFQIVHARGRYWIASIMWDDERPGLTLPEKYLR